MKRVLITGANSYIGTSVEKYLNQWPEKYYVETIDMIDSSWKEKDFSSFDAVYHVAGIAHSDSGKTSIEKEKLYHSVNTDLTIEIAKKAKSDGVKHFIFMSSAIVYGDSAPIGKEKVITKDTKPSPANCYGDSKLQAETGIQKIEDETFKVAILRSPMIYGKGSKGNFPILEKMALTLPIFPRINNQRSMLYIGNLVEFVRLMIENEEQGIFWPQNVEYSNTSELVKMIAETNRKKIVFIPGVVWALKILGIITSLADKTFGNLTYDQSISEYKEEYRRYSLEESIREMYISMK